MKVALTRGLRESSDGKVADIGVLRGGRTGLAEGMIVAVGGLVQRVTVASNE